MLKDVTLGRYFRTQSFLHGLDPRTKLLGALVYIVAVFLSSSPWTLAVSGIVLCLLIILSRVPLKHMVRGLGSIAFIVVFAGALTIIFAEDGVRKTVFITLRLVMLVLGSNLLTLTTRPKDIADGLEKGLSWLRVFRFPVHDLATVISIALRFIPILADEAQIVMDARRVRGSSYSERGFSRRVRSLFPVIVPVFASAFRKADALSDAMDSRLYGTGKASRLHPLSYGRQDAASFVCIFTFLAVIILLKVAGL